MVLRTQRKKLGLTQKEVANRAGIAIQQYQKFEMGQRDIMNSHFETACRVIEALDMNIRDFYHGMCGAEESGESSGRDSSEKVAQGTAKRVNSQKVSIAESQKP